jgi:hypothetical protein
MSSNLDILGYFMPDAILPLIFSELLSLQDICRFDRALCNKKKRLLFLDCIRSESCIWLGDKDRDFNSNMISWLNSRSIKIRRLKCNRISNTIAVKVGHIGSSLHWLSIKDRNMTDENLGKIIDGCPNLQSVELYECRNITDDSIIRLIEMCPHLNSLDLTCCYKTTDLSVVSLAEQCPDLYSLNLDRCNNVTDSSITELAEKCSNLNTLNLSRLYVTDISITRLAENCPHLHCLDVSNCYNITDSSMLILAEKCHHLQRLNLSNCTGITMSMTKLKELFPNTKSFNYQNYVPLPSPITIYPPNY